jgi:YHS domain-containing protein
MRSADLDDGRVVFGEHRPAEEVDFAPDPVCGMEVNKFETRFHTIADGRPFFFCSHACQARFEAEPAAFLPRP